jgi:hypothetical protein
MSELPLPDRFPKQGVADEIVPATLPGLRRRDVLKHAWGHIKESWRIALAGCLVAVVLPPLFKWWHTYHLSHMGLDEVTGGDWVDSLVAVGIWLVLVALWHFFCAPMGHAREVIAAHRTHHAEQIERARREARSEVPRINQHIRNQIVVQSPEQAANVVTEIEHAEAEAKDDARPPLDG